MSGERNTERFASRVSSHYKLLTETLSGPTSYTTAGSALQSRILKMLEKATCLQVTGGYIGEVVTGSITGNQFKLKIYMTTVTATGTAAQELVGGTNLITSSITVLIEGF